MRIYTHEYISHIYSHKCVWYFRVQMYLSFSVLLYFPFRHTLSWSVSICTLCSYIDLSCIIVCRSVLPVHVYTLVVMVCVGKTRYVLSVHV